MDPGTQGLSTDQAKNLLRRHGPNKPSPLHHRPVIVQILLYFIQPLAAVLLFASLVSGLLGDFVNASIIAVIVVFSVALDFFQTYRSQQAAEKLRSRVAPMASCLRGGKWQEVPRRELVPGDIVRLAAGDLVPADARVLEAKDLHLQQAALTGESLPVEKDSLPEASPPHNPAEARNLVFLGSSVVSGTATAQVLATGRATTFGDIAASLSTRPPETEFERGTRRFSLFIMQTVLFLVLFVAVVSVAGKRDPLQSLLFAVALAVGLTPEFLPMIITITLANGAVRMSRQKVVVKNLASIQNFGSIDILCSDKTGTLTSGEMGLEAHVDPAGKTSERVLLLTYLNSVFQSGVDNLLDAAVLRRTNLNPLDAAILKHEHPDVQPYRKLDEVPFDFERRRMTVVVDKGGEHLLITKGAPESVLSVCSGYEMEGSVVGLTAPGRTTCETTYQSLSTQGYRVLAIAYRSMPVKTGYRATDEKDLVLAGFIAFSDPALPDALAVLDKLRQEGVQVKILTGDNELVARHVCEEVGLEVGQIVPGDQLETMTDPALAQVAERTQVFARVSPSQKNRIISALKSRGHVVGYIGDGINDAPSLHTADVGISVSGGVDVAKAAADIILLERSLGVLLAGILEGRKAFGNVMKYLLMGTSSNFGNMFSMAAASVFLPFLPMLPTQILLNNFLYDLAQVTIPTDNVDSSFIHKPRRWNIGLIRQFMLYIGPISSIYDFLTFYALLVYFKAHETLFHTGWFVESLATQTLVIFVIRTAGNPFKSRPSTALALTVLLIVGVGILLPYTPLAAPLGFVALPLGYFLFLAGATLTYLLLVQGMKRWLLARAFS